MEYPIGTMTLAEIKACSPCASEWRRALACFPETPAMTTRVSLGDIALKMNSLTAWWCVRALDWSDITVRRTVISAMLPTIERAAKHTTDQRVHDCITAIHTWCEGDDSVDLAAAARQQRGSKRSSAGSSAGSRTAAARAAARAAAEAAAEQQQGSAGSSRGSSGQQSISVGSSRGSAGSSAAVAASARAAERQQAAAWAANAAAWAAAEAARAAERQQKH